jgi:hypothetical protein
LTASVFLFEKSDESSQSKTTIDVNRECIIRNSIASPETRIVGYVQNTLVVGYFEVYGEKLDLELKEIEKDARLKKPINQLIISGLPNLGSLQNTLDIARMGKQHSDVSSESSGSSHETPISFREPQEMEEQVEVVHVSPHRKKTGRSLLYGIMSQSPGGSTTTKILHSSTPTNSSSVNSSTNPSTAPTLPTSPSSTFIPREPPPVEAVVQPSPSSEAFVIDEGTPAYDALKANADVKVTKVDKFFRGIQAQTVWRVAKKATLKSKSGNVRGKPPRVPPGFNDPAEADPNAKVGLNRVEEGEEEEDELTRPLLSPKEEQEKLKAAAAAGAAAAKKAPFEGDGLTGYEEASKQDIEIHGVMPPLLPILDDESTIQGAPSISTSLRFFPKIPTMVGPALSDGKGSKYRKAAQPISYERQKVLAHILNSLALFLVHFCFSS